MEDSNYYGSEQQEADLLHTAKVLARQVAGREKSYKGSWQKRGGIGAFMMLARKWDRMQTVWDELESAAAEFNYDIWKVWDEMDEFADGEMNDIEDLCGYLLHVINEKRVVEPRRREAQHEEFRKSVVLSDAFDPEKVTVGANPLYPNEVRLTESEWRTLEATGSVQLGNGGILTRLTKDVLMDDSLYDGSHLPAFEGVATRDIEAGEILTTDDIQRQGDCRPHAPASAAEAVDPSSWEASHPHNYPSAGNQCPKCNSTFYHDTGDTCTCRKCGEVFPKKRGTSLYEVKFPKSMTEHRHHNQPETNDITKG